MAQRYASPPRPERIRAINFFVANEIVLKRGDILRVSNKDLPLVVNHYWYAFDTARRTYAVRMTTQRGKRKLIYLHREILQAPPDRDVDHRDGNGLNCVRRNLRLCSRQQNRQAFQRLRLNKTSRYRGVTFHSKNLKWYARITVNFKSVYLGSFFDEIDAARAYDKAAKRLFGSFAYPNFL